MPDVDRQIIWKIFWMIDLIVLLVENVLKLVL